MMTFPQEYNMPAMLLESVQPNVKVMDNWDLFKG
jgi:hypothetical protein